MCLLSTNVGENNRTISSLSILSKLKTNWSKFCNFWKQLTEKQGNCPLDSKGRNFRNKLVVKRVYIVYV